MTGATQGNKIFETVGFFVSLNAELGKRDDMVNIKSAVEFRLVYAAMLASVIISLACFSALCPPVLAVVWLVTAFEIVYLVAAQKFFFAFGRAKAALRGPTPAFGSVKHSATMFALEAWLRSLIVAALKRAGVDSLLQKISVGTSTRTEMMLFAFQRTIIAAERLTAMIASHVLAPIMRFVIAALTRLNRLPFTTAIGSFTESAFNRFGVSTRNLNRLTAPPAGNGNRPAFPGRTMFTVITALAFGDKALLRFRDSPAVMLGTFFARGQIATRNTVSDHPVADGCAIDAEALAEFSERHVFVPV